MLKSVDHFWTREEVQQDKDHYTYSATTLRIKNLIQKQERSFTHRRRKQSSVGYRMLLGSQQKRTQVVGKIPTFTITMPTLK